MATLSLTSGWLRSWAGVGLALAAFSAAGGCGPCGVLASACDRVCCEMADAVAGCVDAGFTWDDVGARDRDDFARSCVDEWDRTSVVLTAYEIQEATLVCRDVDERLEQLDSGSAESCAIVQSWLQE